MIPVAEARARIVAAVGAAGPLPAETVPLTAAVGRVLAAPVTARVSHPASAVSAMDGYAVRAVDTAGGPVALRVIGSAPAGRPFAGVVDTGEAVRIFTGAPVPAGADAVVIQEEATPVAAAADGAAPGVQVPGGVSVGQHIRPAGLDFTAGAPAFAAGHRLRARDLALASAMNVPWLSVRRRPRVAILSTGDEVVMPGDQAGPGQVVNAGGLGVAALVRASGGEPVLLGVAPDRPDALAAAAAAAVGCDVLVTIGGASVGDHDLVREVLGGAGGAIDFWRIAMRPGKPLMFGRSHGVPLLGLPGNPVSSLVTGVLFLRPALAALLGSTGDPVPVVPAVVTTDLPAGDQREAYLRSTLGVTADGRPTVTPMAVQDSAHLSGLAGADALLIRPSQAPPAPAGAMVEVIALDAVGLG